MIDNDLLADVIYVIMLLLFFHIFVLFSNPQQTAHFTTINSAHFAKLKESSPKLHICFLTLNWPRSPTPLNGVSALLFDIMAKACVLYLIAGTPSEDV